MDDRFFFNPYIFPGNFPGNIPPNATFPPNVAFPPNIAVNSSNDKTEISQKDFFENQYYYYRYLNEYLDYQIKSREYTNIINKQANNNSNNSNNSNISQIKN